MPDWNKDNSDLTHTFDGVEITAGLRIWSPYSMKWGTVEPKQFESNGVTAPGGEYFSGWYKVRNDDGTGELFDGSRMATERPPG